MRIRVIDVLEVLAAGETSAHFPGDYPNHEADDIAACRLYATRSATEALPSRSRSRHASGARRRTPSPHGLSQRTTIAGGFAAHEHCETSGNLRHAVRDLSWPDA